MDYLVVVIAVLSSYPVVKTLDAVWWWLHSGPDSFETLPAGGWLDETTETWHGGCVS